MWWLPSALNSQGPKYPLAPKGWDPSHHLHLVWQNYGYHTGWTVLILCVGDQQKIRERQAESYPQHYTHKVHWNKKWLQSRKYCAVGKDGNVWAGTCLLQSYQISVSHRVLLVMCPQTLALVFSVTGHLRFPCFSMPLWFLPNYSTFLKAETELTNVLPRDGIKEAEQGIYWYGSVSWRLHGLHSLCWRSYTGRNL